jgi:hypothetical protein
MIHFALGVAAFLFICILVLGALGVVGGAFRASKGCGCLTLIGVIFLAIVLIAIFG